MISNSSKISIPKEIFENLFFQNGGQKNSEEYKKITDQYIFEVPKQLTDKANSEIENNEYVQTKGTVKKAVGDTHENGGIKTILQDGDKVLSDHLRVGNELAKKISKMYDIKIKPTDTYAKVLDKYLKKIGHTEATKEAEKYIKKLDEQKTKTKDEATLALNQEVLMQEIKEYGDKVNELEQPKLEMFYLLFKAQEDSKKDKNINSKMQNGGNFYDQYNPLFTTNPGYTGKMQEWIGKQSYKPEYELGDVEQTALRFKELADNAGLNYSQEDFKDMKSLNNFAGRLQQHIIDKKPELAQHYGFSVEPTRQGLQYLVDNKKIDPKRLGIKLVDGKVARGSYDTLGENALKEIDTILSHLPEKEKKQYATTNFKDNLAYFRGITSKEQYLPKEEYDKFVQENIPKRIGDSPYYSTKVPGVYVKPYSDAEPNIDNIATKEQLPINTYIPTGGNIEANIEDKRQMGLLLMPDRFLYSPTFRAPMKFSPRIQTGERVEISPEQALTEINRGKQSTEKQLEQLPDAQRAATLSSMDANNAQAVSKVIAETSRYNAQAREKESYENAEARTRQSIADAQASAQYQQLIGQELEQYDRELQKINNIRFQDQFQKWLYVNQMNRNNALNRDVVFTGNGYEVTPEALKAQEERLNTVSKESVGKKGGKFLRKRFV